jgi:3-oxoacyl-(acyl-carrier-protein) synthase/3-hydroxymyristoyl/3-hydroxydecanoyl-(acyl carrier protein) dehydratase
VHKNTIWPISKKPRRAAINAFGFGGINAHMVLSEYRKKETSSKPEAKKPEETDLAIVGLGMHIGGFRSVEEFLQGLTTGKTSFRVPEESRWRGFSVGDEYMEVLGLTEMPPGAYINSFEFDSMRFRMPVVGSPFFLRRDMLLLETAAEAIDDAGLKRGQNPRTAVLVHTATDFSDHLFNSVAEFEDRLLTSMIKSCPELTKAQREEIIKILREEDETRENPDSVPGLITSVRGCRISAHWGFTGPSFSVFDQEVSIFRCLELARFFLSENIVDQVVIAVASLTGELPHIYAQKVLGQMEMMSERGIGEGIVALVVKRRETALDDGNRVYALVSGIGISNDSDDLQVSAKDALEKTIRQAGLGEKELCALEVPYSYEQADRKLPSNRTLIEELCCHAAGACLDPEQFRVQEIEKHLGFGFSLSAAASVVRQALQLYLGEVLDGGGESATPWENKDGKQVALVTGYSRQNTFGCVALKEMTPRDQIEKNLVTRLIPFPIRFVTQVDLLEGLGNMKGNLQKINFSNFYDLIWTDFASTSALAAGGKERVAVLMGYSRNILLTEIDQLTEYLQSLPDHNHEIAYESSRGSYCATGHYGFQLAAAPAEGASANEIARKFGEEFGLSTELIRLLGLSETVMFYRPAGVLLSLGAKLLSHRIDFQWEKFFSNFHYQVLEQPSNIVEICNGIPKLLDWFASPEHKQRLAEKGAVPVPQQPAPPAKPTVAVKPSVAARSAVTTKPTMVAKPQVRQMKKSGPVPAKAPVASAVIDSAVVSSIKGSYQAYQFMADLEVQTLQTVMEISESLASGSYSNVSLSSSNRNLSKGSLSDASLPGKGNGAIPIQKQVIWDYPQILEMSSGKIENVLGEQYRASDAKAIRLGLPLPPLMLVSRITGLEAEFGRLEPCRIQGEYDVNDDCLLMLSKNTTALALTTEAAQIATVLLMYLGVDQLYEQEMSVRLLNSKTWYHHDLPVRGDTLRFVCEIKQFIKQKKGLLIHSSYACFVKDKLVLSIDSTISVFPADEPDHREESPTQAVPTLIGLPQGVLPGFCLPQQQTLRYSMGEFYEGKCGFRVYPGRSFSEPERLNVPPSARMVDRIVSVEFNGGRYGLGMVVGEADLDDSHWAFGVNLPNNPVFPGCLQTMAANQLQLYFAVCAGHLGDGDYYLERLKDLPESTSFLGQIRPGRGVLRYELQVKSIRTLADKVVFVADCECFWQDQRVSQFADISLVILKSIL